MVNDLKYDRIKNVLLKSVDIVKDIADVISVSIDIFKEKQNETKDKDGYIPIITRKK